MNPSSHNLTAKTSGPELHRRIRQRARDFGRDESGVLIVFGLIIFVMMLIVGGMAVDLMRFETTRAKLQATADRCSLAAASLRQTQDPETVVNDCFDKAGALEYLAGTVVTNGFNARTVSAEVDANVDSVFMQMIGIESLQAPTDSTAEERITDVEISLVLDVSNSMNSSSRIQNLKTAASSFVDTIFAGDTENKISLTLVPYNGQVNLGTTLLSRYNVSAQHTYNTCVDFTTSHFSTTALSTTTALTRSDNIDPWYSTSTTQMLYCATGSSGATQLVRPYLRNTTTIKAAINGLIANGNTSIDIGMKWGMAFLDPGTQGVITAQIATGAIPAYFAGRPYAFDREDTAKIIVIMSDGENTSEFTLNSAYKTGNTDVYRNPSNGTVTIYHPTRSGTSKYYQLTSSQISSGSSGNWFTSVNGGASAVRYTWPSLFNAYPVNWVAYHLYARPLGGSTTTWYNTFVTSVAPATKDTRLDAICDAAKAQGVRVFTIGFEAPAAGITALSNCASAPADFFDVDGLEISTAFQTIARQISQLRLTQ